MDQNLRRLLLDTLSANEVIRNGAERQLKGVEKDPQLLLHLQQSLMRDPDPTVQQIASIYFTNTMRRNWKEPAVAPVVQAISEQILQLLLIESPFSQRAYRQLLLQLLEDADTQQRCALITRAAPFLAGGPAEQQSALTLLESLFKVEALRYNLDSVLEAFFDAHGELFLRQFGAALAAGAHAAGKMYMKVLARAYTHYSLPDFLLRREVFVHVFSTALDVARLPVPADAPEPLVKMQKWAFFFLFKATNKGLKKYFKSPEFIEFVRTPATLESLVNVFLGAVARHAEGALRHQRIAMYACDFFVLLASNKHAQPLAKKHAMYLLGTFVLPAQVYNEETREQFEYEEEKYLWERYNFVSFNLRTATTSLFSELLDIDKETRALVLGALQACLQRPASPERAAYKYGVLGLLANAQRAVLAQLGAPGFAAFVAEHVLPELRANEPQMVSQALHFLSLCEECALEPPALDAALKCVVGLMGVEHPILPVEACLAMNFFFGHADAAGALRPLVPALLERVLLFSKQHFLESLSNLTDTIIEHFADDVAAYAPQLAEALCANVMAHLESQDDNKIATVSNFLTTIEKLVASADGHAEIVRRIYAPTSKVILAIFTRGFDNFYQEAFDLMNSFLFTLEAIDAGMLDVFAQALAVNPDDLCLYPREVSDFIDNFLSYGKAAMVSEATLKSIYGAIELFVRAEDGEDVYDEDFEAGCRIIDSLMLNAGAAAHALNPALIPCLVQKVVACYTHFLEGSGSLDVHALESLMHCFLVAPEVTLGAMQASPGPAGGAGFARVFFAEALRKHTKFRRVHDKKVYVLFVGQLFKMEAGLELDYPRLNEALVETVCSLPAAIRYRNKLKAEEERAAAAEEDGDSDEDTVDSLDEDIWFETVLDTFDAYGYVRGMLATTAPRSVGEAAVCKMNEAQVARLQAVLQGEHEQQK